MERINRLKEILTKDYTVENILTESFYNRTKESQNYKRLGDWSGLALNKIVLGAWADSQAGLLPGTSAMTRTLSLLLHSVTSPVFTHFRDSIYTKGRITKERSEFWQYGAELLAHNGFQTPVYVAQVAAALYLRSTFDSSVEFDFDTVVRGGWEFFKASWWMAPAGKYMMKLGRAYFGAQIPEEVAQETLEKKVVEA